MLVKEYKLPVRRGVSSGALGCGMVIISSLVAQSVRNLPRIPWFGPWVRKIPCRREQQPTPVFLPGESHGQRSLAGYHPWGHELDMTQRLTHDMVIICQLCLKKLRGKEKKALERVRQNKNWTGMYRLQAMLSNL